MPSLADIYLARGQAESNAALRRAAIESQRSQGNAQAWSGAIQNIGGIAANALQNYAQQKEQAPLNAEKLKQAQQQTQIQGMQIEDAQNQRANAAAEPGKQQTLAQILAQSRTTDPQTGAAMIDHTKLMDGLTAAGLQGRYETLKPIIESYDKNSAEAATKQAAAMKDMAGIVADDKFSVDSFITGIDDLVGRGLMSETYAMPMIKRAQEDPNFVKGFTSHVLGIKDQGPIITKPGDIGRDPNDPSKVLFQNPEAAPKPAAAPNVGSVEDFLIKKYGPNPTPQQVLQGRAQFEAAGRAPNPDQQKPVGDFNKQREEFLASIPQEWRATVKSLGDYHITTNTALASRDAQTRNKIMQWVQQYNPDYDEGVAPTRIATRKDFTSGAKSNNIVSLNTAISHAGKLADLAIAMQNGDTPAINSIVNYVQTALGHSEVTNAKMAATALAGESAQTFKKSGGTDPEIAKFAAMLNTSQSPAQIQDGLHTLASLFAGRFDALAGEYENSMGKKDMNFLTKDARSQLSKFGIDANTWEPAGGSTVFNRGGTQQPSTPPPTVPALSGHTRMQKPDGTFIDVPNANVEAAKKLGAVIIK